MVINSSLIATGYNSFFSDEGFVVLQVSFNHSPRKTFVFDGFDDMAQVAIDNPSIPFSVWELLALMQSESSAYLESL